MSTAIQRRRGTTTQHSTFTGLAGELSIDTTKNTVVVHDGSTVGGIPLAKESGPLTNGGSTKLATTTSGISVTGSVTADGLTVEANAPYIEISNTGENAGGIKMYDSGGASTQYFNLTYDSGASNTVGFDTGASGEFTFSVNTDEKLRISSTGNVGIGTDSPANTLDVRGGIDISRTATYTAKWSQEISHPNSSSYGSLYTVPSLTTAKWYLANTSWVPKFTVDPNNGDVTTTGNVTMGGNLDVTGNVGIGTSSPLSLLDVTLEATGQRRFLVNYDDSAITIKGSNGSSNPESLRVVASTFKVNTGTSGSGTERMVISSTGNVGIGLGSGTPAARLHVASGIYESDTEIIRLGRNDSAVRYHSIYANASATPATSKIQFKIHDGVTTTSQATVLTLTGAGNMGLGVTPESDWHSSNTALQLGLGASIYGDTTATGNQSSANARATQGSSLNGYKYISTDKASTYQQYDGQHNFRVAPSGTAGNAISWTTAMIIDNNSVVTIGKQSTAGGKGLSIYPKGSSTNIYAAFNKDSSSLTPCISFQYNGSQAGAISYSSSATSFITSSDYRLKENVVPMSGSIDRLKALKPSKFNFIADADKTVDGFLAHEAQAVVPECVTGEKDAMMMEEYEVTPAVMDGETVVTEAVMGEREVPDYQGIDQAKLVPLLVGAIQELTARLETLENK